MHRYFKLYKHSLSRAQQLKNPGFEVYLIRLCDNVLMLLLHVHTSDIHISENQVFSSCVTTKVKVNTTHLSSTTYPCYFYEVTAWTLQLYFSLGHEDNSKVYISDDTRGTSLVIPLVFPPCFASPVLGTCFAST